MKTVVKTFDVSASLPEGDAGDQGAFDALVSVFGNVDSGGDIVDKGAFAESLAQWNASGKQIPVVWDHQWDDIWAHIGGATAEETDDGLLLHAQLDLDNPTAVQAYKLLKDGRVSEFSFAARVREDGWSLETTEDGRVVQHLTGLDLIEAGPTLKGANPDTALVSIKNGVDVIQKEGRILATKHVETLKSIRESLDGVIAAVDIAEEKSQDQPPQQDLPPLDAGVEEKASDKSSGAFLMPSKRAAAQLELINLSRKESVNGPEE